MNTYIVDGATQAWVSDAVVLKSIEIDTARYYLFGGQRAFDIRTYYANSSNLIPYELEELTLYIRSGDTLKKVLDTYEVMHLSGENLTYAQRSLLKATPS